MLPVFAAEVGIVADPEIRFAQNGRAWATIRCVAKDRVRGENGQWSDGDPCFIDVVVNQGAEHLADSVMKGDSLLVIGKLKQRHYEVDGQKRSSYQVTADSVGVSLRWGPAKSSKVTGDSGAVRAVADAFGATEVQESAPPF